MSKRNKRATTCSPKCIYYPTEPNEVIREYVDEFGLRHREAKILCLYDDHLIKEFKKCRHYKEEKIFE